MFVTLKEKITFIQLREDNLFTQNLVLISIQNEMKLISRSNIKLESIESELRRRKLQFRIQGDLK